MRIFFLFFLFFSTISLSAQTDAPGVEEKLIFPKDQLLPKNIYVNQIIPIKVDAIIAEDIFDSIDTVFEKNYGIELLTQDPVWYILEQNSFSLTYYIKIKEAYIKFPDLKASVMRNGSALDTSTIKGEKVRASKIQPNNQFCSVLAKSLVVKNHKIDKYDGESNIIVLEMETTLGNLEDFSLPFVKEEGIDWVDIELPTTRVFYYAIIPNSMRALEFNYFDPEIGEFKKVSTNFDFSKFGEKVSTQIEINPNKKNFPYMRTIFISLLILLFLILFAWRKNYVYLAVSLIISLSLFFILQEKAITIKGGAKIYLLPTKNSSIFYTTEYIMETEMIKKRNGYYKILLPDEKIGWIKEDDVFKN